ncbi:unnamed protein product [Ectocarpus sp. 6 AP-2014]
MEKIRHALVENDCFLSALNKAPAALKAPAVCIIWFQSLLYCPPAPPTAVNHGDNPEESNTIDLRRRINEEAGDNSYK